MSDPVHISFIIWFFAIVGYVFWCANVHQQRSFKTLKWYHLPGIVIWYTLLLGVIGGLIWLILAFPLHLISQI